MLYYKVFKGYTEYVPIDETELEKALAAFKFGTAVIFNSGAVEKIEAIIPDLNRSMGWNPSYKLGDDDWNDIRNKGIERKCAELHQKTKEKIEYLIETKQQHLIGKNAEVKLPERPKELSAMLDGLKTKLT